MIKEFYSGKTILLAGCSGFVGKVVLEKFLRVLSSTTKDLYLIMLTSKIYKNVLLGHELSHCVRSFSLFICERGESLYN